MAATYFTGNATATAGTEITSVCPAREGMVPVLRGFSYTPAGTSHNLYLMKALGVTTTGSFTASGGTTIELTKIDVGRDTANEEETLANLDWVVYQLEDGSWEANEISSVSAATITVSAVGGDIATGSKVWAYYEPARSVHKKIRCVTGGTTTFDNLNIQGGVPKQDGVEISVSGLSAPGLVLVDNLTAAGQMEWCSWTWTTEDYVG